LEAFIASTVIVAIGEIGDKTQLLALMLAARYRRPVVIILGIAAATLVNHALAAWLGDSVRLLAGPEVLRWALALSFFAIALWALRPDQLDGDSQPQASHGAFAATFIAFFLAEMGDKTQVATVALAATYPGIVAVVAGSTLGMLLANAPAVALAHKAAVRIPFRFVRRLAAAMFAAMGVAVLIAF
jgi:Ca2+/H+ antiporter, TMEM165/GDT1 family